MQALAAVRGLTAAEAAARLSTDGPNTVTALPPKRLAARIGRQLADPLVALLIVAAVVTTALGDFPDTAVIALVITVNTIVGALTGAATWDLDTGSGTTTGVPLGVVSIGLLVAGISLLFTARYPGGLFDLLMGVARWNLRVTSYLTLLTPRYPPFRLDQGAGEPDAPPPAPTSAALSEPRSSGGGVAGPVTALIAGVLLLAPGVGLIAGGGALLALDGARDSAGYVTSPALSVQSSTAAITTEGITLQAGDLWTRGLSDIGGVRITATGSPATPLFVGIARESDVDRWLAGTAHDEVIEVSSDAARYDRSTGARKAVVDPQGQDFWLASDSDAGSATVTWQATNGNFAVVLVNADGSPGVVADVRAATEVPDLTGLGTGLLTTGIVLFLLAMALIVLGGTGLGRRHGGTPPVSGPSPGPPIAGPSPTYETAVR